MDTQTASTLLVKEHPTTPREHDQATVDIRDDQSCCESEYNEDDFDDDESDSQERYYFDTDNSEDPYCYYEDGLHPILLGDVLDDAGRFKVVHKLGNGGFATVWLCRDTLLNVWRAVKVVDARNSREDYPELLAQKHLGCLGREEAESHHIALPIEHFWITGPNGRHLCLVLPLLGPTVQLVSRHFVSNPDLVKDVTFQMVEAMTYLHSKGICHGDFRPDNILFQLDGVDNLSEEQMIQVLGEPMLMHLRTGKKMPANAPKYLVGNTGFSAASGLCLRKIAVIDFGQSYQATDGPIDTGIPREYAAPEMRFDATTLGFGADIWSLACSIAALRVGDSPFEASCEGAAQTLEDILGPLPEPYRSGYIEAGYEVHNADLENPDELPVSVDVDTLEEWRFYRKQEPGCNTGCFLEYLIATTKRHLDGPPEAYEDGDSAARGVLPPYGTDWDNKFEYQIPKEEAAVLLDLLKQMLQYAPADRASLETVQNHPWFGGRKSILSQQPRFLDTCYDALSHVLSSFWPW